VTANCEAEREGKENRRDKNTENNSGEEMHMPRSTPDKRVQNDGKTPRWRLSKATAAQGPIAGRHQHRHLTPTPESQLAASRAGDSWYARPLHWACLWRQALSVVGALAGSYEKKDVVGEEGHESDRPHRIGRTERAPSADLLGCVSACVQRAWTWSRRKKNRTHSRNQGPKLGQKKKKKRLLIT
jgi:hypothetical protein